jgi:hypothetical protein
MAKGNNYPAAVAQAMAQQAETAIHTLESALSAVPDLGPDVLSKATITPERLPLADLALQAANLAPDVMRRSFDPARLTGKLAAYRLLLGLLNRLLLLVEKLRNALNVLGSDIIFDVNNIHEDIEKDNGETQDLGQLRGHIHAYYERPGGRKPRIPRK